MIASHDKQWTSGVVSDIEGYCTTSRKFRSVFEKYAIFEEIYTLELIKAIEIRSNINVGTIDMYFWECYTPVFSLAGSD